MPSRHARGSPERASAVDYYRLARPRRPKAASRSTACRSPSRSCSRTSSGIRTRSFANPADVLDAGALESRGDRARASCPFLPSRVVLAGLHRRPRGGRSRGHARRRGARRRRSRAHQSPRPRRSGDRSLGAGRRLRHAAARSPRTSRASTSAIASATSCCAGARRRSRTFASSRPAPASSTR